MLLDIFLLIIGLILILGGANYMTDGAAAVARRLGMSDFMVGLTVVSMMTSAPELVVSIVSASHGSAQMAIGNIVGSNIFNILVIVGVVALVRPINIGRGILVNEIPLVILSSVVLLIMGNAPLLDHGSHILSRVDGLLLLLFFVIFMRYTINSAKATGEPTGDNDTPQKTKIIPLPKALIFLFGGLAALIFGGQWFVDGATGLARAIGWSEALIGLTILAAGTSLPELATSVAAAMKGMPGMCIGNVIGSCIFNIFFVLGLTSTVLPLEFGSIGNLDLLTLTGASLLFWIVGWFWGNRCINRAEGALMLILYIGYIIALYTRI